MKTKVLVYTALFGAAMLAAGIYIHVSGKGELSLGAIIAICLGAPVVGLAMWFRHDWVPKKMAEISEKERADRDQP